MGMQIAAKTRLIKPFMGGMFLAAAAASAIVPQALPIALAARIGFGVELLTAIAGGVAAIAVTRSQEKSRL